MEKYLRTTTGTRGLVITGNWGERGYWKPRKSRNQPMAGQKHRVAKSPSEDRPLQPQEKGALLPPAAGRQRVAATNPGEGTRFSVATACGIKRNALPESPTAQKRRPF